MTITELATTLAAFTAVLTFIGAVVTWVFKNYANKLVGDLTKDYLSELKPNSGSSLKDAVNSIKRDVSEVKRDITDVKIDLSALEGKFDQHIRENAK